MRKSFKNKESKIKHRKDKTRFYIEPETKGGRKCKAKLKNPRIYIGKLKIANRFTKEGEENGHSKN